MRAGDLRKRVSLQRKSSMDGSAGQPIISWPELVVIWAEIEPLTAQQRVVAQAIHPDVSHRITVRYRPDFANPLLVTALRIVYKGRIFSIQGALNVNERNVKIDLVASEGINDG